MSPSNDPENGEYEEIIELGDNSAEGDIPEEDEEGMDVSGDENEIEQFGVSDDSCVAFQAHDQDTFAVGICKDKYVASGGEDDRAFLWDWSLESETPNKIEHKDSVISVEFNNSGSLLATADISGLIIVTNTSDSSTRYSLEETGDLEWAIWHPKKDWYFCGAQDGTTWLWEFDNEDAAFPEYKVYATHGSVTTFGCCTPDGSKLLVGYADGTLKCYDIKTGSSVSRHLAGSISYIAHHPTISVSFVGTQAGFVYTLNTNAPEGLPIFSKCEPDILVAPRRSEEDMDDEEAVKQSVESIAVCEKNSWFAIGRNDGTIKFHEVQHAAPRSVVRSAEGMAVNCCVWVYKSDKALLLAGSVDGTVKLLDPRDGSLVKEYGCGGDAALDMKVLRMEPLKFIVGCAGGMLRVFDDSVVA